MSVRIADVEEILIGDQVVHDTGGEGSVQMEAGVQTQEQQQLSQEVQEDNSRHSSDLHQHNHLHNLCTSH